MGRYIDWYLVEVERLLCGTLSREKLHDSLGEVETHLLTAKEDAAQRGMLDTEAELAAIESFGTARNFVRAFVEENPPLVQRWLLVLASFLATAGIVVLSLIFVANPELWVAALVAVLLCFFVLSSKATRPLRWRALGAIFGVSVLVQLFVAGSIYVPIATHWGTSFIERSRASDIVTGHWEPRKTLSGSVHPSEKDLPARAQAALKAGYLETTSVFLGPIVAYNCVGLGGLLAIHYAGYGLGLLARRRGRRRLLA